jgi:hypothetical protein
VINLNLLKSLVEFVDTLFKDGTFKEMLAQQMITHKKHVIGILAADVLCGVGSFGLHHLGRKQAYVNIGLCIVKKQRASAAQLGISNAYCKRVKPNEADGLRATALGKKVMDIPAAIAQSRASAPALPTPPTLWPPPTAPLPSMPPSDSPPVPMKIDADPSPNPHAFGGDFGDGRDWRVQLRRL